MRRPLPLLVLIALALALAAAASGCGEKSESNADIITGPGIVATAPPWKPQYQALAERMKRFGVPPPGTEKFHHHAQLHVYNDGLLVPVPTHIGLGSQPAGLHTHAPGGVIHIESSKPFTPTLGAFFGIWGVAFGPEQLGNLKNSGSKKVHVVANGKPVADPIHYLIHEGDNIVVAYGEDGSFPTKPDTTLLRDVQSGKTPGCGATKKGQKKKQKSCTAP
jgi:hypothetical protein